LELDALTCLICLISFFLCLAANKGVGECSQCVGFCKTERRKSEDWQGQEGWQEVNSSGFLLHNLNVHSFWLTGA